MLKHYSRATDEWRQWQRVRAYCLCNFSGANARVLAGADMARDCGGGDSTGVRPSIELRRCELRGGVQFGVLCDRFGVPSGVHGSQKLSSLGGWWYSASVWRWPSGTALGIETRNVGDR